MELLTKAQSKILINNLFESIPSIYNEYTLLSDDLLQLNITREKQHRKYSSSQYNFPVKDTAKYFTIKYLFSGMSAVNGDGQLYTIQALLHIRLECLKGHAYAMENKDKLQEWYKLVSDSRFSEIDYCELIK